MHRQKNNELSSDAAWRMYRSRRKRAKQEGDYSKLSDVYVEMADYLREIGYIAKAEQKYINAIIIGEKVGHDENCAIAYRSLAEFAVEREEVDDAIVKIDEAMRYALHSNDPNRIQLTYHQRAYIYGEKQGMLTKALEIGLEALEYLQNNAEAISQNRKAVENGGSVMCRMSRLEVVLCAFYWELGNRKEAYSYSDRSVEHAKMDGSPEQIAIALVKKSDLKYGPERLRIAEEAAWFAEKIVIKDSETGHRDKADARLHLAQERLRFNQISESKNILWSLYKSHRNSLDRASNEKLSKYLCFIYKTEKRLKKTKNLRSTETTHIFEKIADDASNMEMHELALRYYEKMLQTCTTLEKQRGALISLAETAKDLENYSLSLKYYKDILAAEEQLELPHETILETKNCIANMAAKVDSISVEERQQYFEDAYQFCQTMSEKPLRLEILCLENYIYFLEKNGIQEDKTSKLKIALDHFRREREYSFASSTDDRVEETYDDEFDQMNEGEIFARLKEQMKFVEEEKKIEKEIDAKVNNNGETRLHLAAKAGDYKLTKELIEKGYNVNVEDNGGWTPLSEAVSGGYLPVVRLLLQKGARVDSTSTETLVTDDGEIVSGGGQTPLMEACANGNKAIIDILIHFKANVTLTDDNGWTAVEHLRNHVLSNPDLDNIKKESLQKVLASIEDRQRKAGMSPQKSLPTLRNNSKSKAKHEEKHNSTSMERPRSQQAATENDRNLAEYKRTMQALVRKRNNDTTGNVDRDRNFGGSLADAADERNLMKNSIKDRALPADRAFLAPEEDDSDDDIILVKKSKKLRILNSRSPSPESNENYY
ncbi:ankyrin repeats (3 copies) domain-containing protein [Ditylenchus destructor]|uniref:Ankyrin repeats (3 copies) domain-containing protein n=1 Tax=Ditylenchus destructor TaxID=166010 RepID=A0AAD4NJW1_9BILA|nr:ankyrin repeats (3 copies) domain-containing protein [Ditylenchus destructor]